MALVLIVDDDLLVRHRLQREFEDLEVELLTADTVEAAVQVVTQDHPDVVILDVMLPDGSGLEAFQRIHEMDPRTPVIFITAGEESATAIEAMRLGAYDYLLKPLNRRKLRELVCRAIEIRRLMDTPVDWESAPGTVVSGGDLLVGRSEAMQQVYKQVGRVAPQDVTVLITGESGTGKELVARAIYQHSGRSNSKFLAINCAAIPESLLESELFGHEKGAFTGAEERRIGKFEQCTGGTLFLDEIGDMSPPTQSKILRVLQEQRFERVGGTETIQTDVRIIAATHHDLQQLTRAGRFRKDLLYRLNGFTIHLPPLRERGEDLPLLLNHFLTRFSNQMGKDVQRTSPETLRLLNNYDWPGNIRELQSVLKNAILQSSGPELLADFLPDLQRDSPAGGPHGPSAPSDSSQEFVRQRLRNGSTNLYQEALQQMERQLLTQVLRHTGGNQLKAAEILGMTRGTLRKKIRVLDIQIERVVDEGGQDEPTAPE